MKSHKFRLVALAAIGLCASIHSASAVPFTDTFDSIDPAWVTDRYEPAGFKSVNFDGDNRLELSVSGAQQQSSSFYNTQGRQREAGISGSWILSGQVYLSSGMLNGSADPWATSLWARTGVVGNEATANYPIIRLEDVGAGTVVKVWDPEAGGYVSLGDGGAFEGWNSLSILSAGGVYSYYMNNALLYTDLTTTFPEDLTTAFVQGHNFGGDRTYYWDNISASSVPDGGTTGVLMAGSLACLGMVRHRFASRRV